VGARAGAARHRKGDKGSVGEELGAEWIGTRVRGEFLYVFDTVFDSLLG
jgi:hypothetical protein